MRGGQIFPYQNTFNKFIANSKALNKEKTQLYIIPDSETHIASGDIIFDNDEHDTLAKGNYYYIHIDFYINMMTFTVKNEMKTAYQEKDIYLTLESLLDKSLIILRVLSLEPSSTNKNSKSTLSNFLLTPSISL